jgi:hypothetical protein
MLTYSDFIGSENAVVQTHIFEQAVETIDHVRFRSYSHTAIIALFSAASQKPQAEYQFPTIIPFNDKTKAAAWTKITPQL